MASNARFLNFAWQICVDDKTGQVPLHEFINTPARTACESRFASDSRRTIALQRNDAMCQYRKSRTLFDHLIGACE